MCLPEPSILDLKPKKDLMEKQKNVVAVKKLPNTIWPPLSASDLGIFTVHKYVPNWAAREW